MSRRLGEGNKMHGPSVNAVRQRSPIDVHVGMRVRLRRKTLCVSPSSLAEQMGITFQQLRKYERGDNRVSSSRLFDLSRILGVPCAYFFREMGSQTVQDSLRQLAGSPEHSPDQNRNYTLKREALELVRIYFRIGDRHLRQHFVSLVRAIARLDD